MSLTNSPIEIIISMSSIFDWIVGSVGELFVFFFDKLTQALIESVSLKDTYTSTFMSIFFSSGKPLGLFAGKDSIFSSINLLTMFRSASLVIILILTTISLFKCLFGNLVGAEPPSKIIFRAMAYTFAIGTYEIWTNAILKLVFSPIFKAFKETTAGNVFSSLYATRSQSDDGVMAKLFADTNMTYLALDTIKAIILLIALFPLGIQIIKMILEIVERFTILFFQMLFGPLCIACGASMSTENVAKKWFSTYINAHIGLIINILFIKLGLLSVSNWAANFSDGGTNMFFAIVQYCAVYAIFKVGCEADQHMARLGLDMLQAGGLQMAMAAGLAGGAKAILGDGRGAGPNSMFGNSAMRNLAKSGNGAAKVASALGGRGLIGNAIAAGAVATGLGKNKDVLGAAAAGSGLGSMVAAGAFGVGTSLSQNGAPTDTKRIADKMAQSMRTNRTGKVKNEAETRAISAALASQGVISKDSAQNNEWAYSYRKGKDGQTNLCGLNKATGEQIAVGDASMGANGSNFKIGEQTFAANVSSAKMADNLSGAARSYSNGAAEFAEALSFNAQSDNNSISPNTTEEESEGLAGRTSATVCASSDCNLSPSYNGATSQVSQGEFVPLEVSNGKLVTCDAKGRAEPGGAYYRTTSGEAMPKSSVTTTSDGSIAHYNNVGSKYLCNMKDGSQEWVDKRDIPKKKQSGDVVSFVKNSQGQAITGSALSTLNISNQLGTPVSATSVQGYSPSVSAINDESGNTITLGENSYKSVVTPSVSGQVTNIGGESVAAQFTGDGEVQTKTHNGQLYAKAQTFSKDATGKFTADASGSHYLVNGSFIKTSDVETVGSDGYFKVDSSSISQQVRMFDDKGTETTDVAKANQVMDANGQLQKIDTSFGYATQYKVDANDCIVNAAGSRVKVHDDAITATGGVVEYNPSTGDVQVGSGYTVSDDGNLIEIGQNANVKNVEMRGDIHSYAVANIPTDSEGNINFEASNVEKINNGLFRTELPNGNEIVFSNNDVYETRRGDNAFNMYSNGVNYSVQVFTDFTKDPNMLSNIVEGTTHRENISDCSAKVLSKGVAEIEGTDSNGDSVTGIIADRSRIDFAASGLDPAKLQSVTGNDVFINVTDPKVKNKLKFVNPLPDKK